MVSAGHVCDTRGSGIVSSTADVLWMSVVCGMRGVGGVCEMCICLACCCSPFSLVHLSLVFLTRDS